ncbi:caspase family protein [Embleya sp. NPDC127516]|uniref:caspase family protein n=1 Tax=Embleya sp. NPDC127516 TaxID=3363990 RepID=UPI00381D9935
MTAHALLVCVEHYPEHEGSPEHLPGALAQTLELVEWLSRCCGARRGDITVLASVSATSRATADRLRGSVSERSILLGPGAEPGELRPEQIESAIAAAADAWRDGDRFLLYWSGHGYLTERGRRLELPAWHPVDGPPRQRVISVEDMLTHFGSIPRRVDQFVVFETCANRRHDPRGIVLNLTAEGTIAKSAKARVSAAFAADDGQFARRPGDRAVFTRALLEHLAVWGSNALTERGFKEVFDAIDAELARAAPGGRPLWQSPRYRGPGETRWRTGERDPEDPFGIDGRRLIALLADLEIAPGEQAVLRTYLCEQHVPEWVVAGDDLVAWGRALMSLPAAPGRHPVRHLLEWLHACCRQVQVAEWADRLREAGHIADFEPSRVRVRQPLTLVLFVREDDHSPEDRALVRYDTEPQFYVGSERFAPPPEPIPGASLPADRLGGSLAAFYLAVRAHWTSLDRAGIQVVVPTELLNEPFESTVVGSAEDHIVLGEHHEVVLRPLVRHGIARPMHYDTWAGSAHLRTNPALWHLDRHRCGRGGGACDKEVVGFLQDYGWRHRPGEPGTVERAVGRGDWAMVWTDRTTCTDACAGVNGSNGSNQACSGSLVGEDLYRMLDREDRKLAQLPSTVARLRGTLGRKAASSERVVLLFDDPGWCPWQGAGLLRSTPRAQGTHRG